MDSLKQMLAEMMPKLVADKKNLLNRYKENPDVQEFMLTYNITDDELSVSLNQLQQFLEEKRNCDRCEKLEQCPNLLKGHYTSLIYQFGQVQTNFTKCDRLNRKEMDSKRQKLFKNQYIPEEILKATFKDIEPTHGREDGLTALLEFCASYKVGQRKNGVYLYGPLGVGKSHMMVATAKKLADQGIDTLMVYVPDFFREMKSSIQDKTYNEKMEILQQVQVLILDDIGAETISQWERDEILGAILQARMVRGLPTLYTSNLTYDDLEEHLSYSHKGGEERLKAKRIMERIRHYTVPYFIDGPNRRML